MNLHVVLYTLFFFFFVAYSWNVCCYFACNVPMCDYRNFFQTPFFWSNTYVWMLADRCTFGAHLNKWHWHPVADISEVARVTVYWADFAVTVNVVQPCKHCTTHSCAASSIVQKTGGRISLQLLVVLAFCAIHAHSVIAVQLLTVELHCA